MNSKIIKFNFYSNALIQAHCYTFLFTLKILLALTNLYIKDKAINLISKRLQKRLCIF
jgi:hypothetical protein